MNELNDKASRAWFGISNIVFKNKRMQVDRIFSLFDSLITPVATYGSPLWLPFNIPVNCTENKTRLISFWEKFKCETINQKCAKIALSVNKKSPRLAVLGELGRYPLFLQSLAQCLNYKLSLFSRKNSNVLVGNTIREMEGLCKMRCDNWLSRVEQIANLFNIPKTIFFNKSSGRRILKSLKSSFDIHFLNKINEFKGSNLDNLDHNKLRTYKTIKSSFTRELYIDLVRNRNQRCFLSRLRVSSHNLHIELGRHTRPVTPAGERFCKYCSLQPPPCPTCPASSCQCTAVSLSAQPAAVDCEFHFLAQCPVFDAARNTLFTRLNELDPHFTTLSLTDKFKTMLCPTSAISVKLIVITPKPSQATATQPKSNPK